MTYAEYLVAKAPPWMQTAEGAKMLRAIGATLDDLFQEYKAATKVRMVKVAPADALRHIGWERGLPQIPGESADQYRIRLAGAWLTWLWAGTDRGILNALELLSLGNVVIKPNREWVPLPPDDDTAYWSRFWVFIFPPHPWASWTIGSGEAVGETSNTIGSTATAPEVDLVQLAVATWKPSHALCVESRLVLAGQIIGVGGEIGDGATVGASSIAWPG